MAYTLAAFAQDMDRAVRERYAAYDGRRIPCASGRRAYHRTPHAAERCCRSGIAFLISAIPAASPSLATLPWRGTRIGPELTDG